MAHDTPVGAARDSDGRATVLVGVTGSIAAYKACDVVRGLVKAGVRVRVIMTEHSREFVGEQTFFALSGEPVETELFGSAERATHHIDLAHDADCLLIVPATANVLGKLAHGIADDLLSTIAVATRAPIVVAPAMNPDMFLDPTVQDNLSTLRTAGVTIVSPVAGEVVCGDTGVGKLAEVDDIVRAALDAVDRGTSLTGVRVVVTAGPTVEPIDSVRSITNRSSGVMGYAVAAEFVARGAQVTLVSGPTALPPVRGASIISVRSAREMELAARTAVDGAHVFVGAAAVADFRVAGAPQPKLHRGEADEQLTLTLIPNADILAGLGEARTRGELSDLAVLVGFAAEDLSDGGGPLVERGRAKLVRKRADLMVANNISAPGIGFDAPDNDVEIISASSSSHVGPAPKRDIARAVVTTVASLLDKNSHQDETR